MDEKEQRAFIRFLYSELKNYSRELMAYQLFAETLKVNGVRGIDGMLQECRESATLKKRLDENFRSLEEIIPPIDADFQDQVKQFLERWKPTEKPN
jgi:hypothetical protein